MKKQIVILLVMMAFLVLGVSQAGAFTYYSNRSDIAISSGTVDIGTTLYYNGTTTTHYVNFTLPCYVGNLTHATTVFTITSPTGVTGRKLHYNLTVNGNVCNATSVVANQSHNHTTLTQMVTAGVLDNATYLNLSFNVNNSHNQISLVIKSGANAPLRSAWINDVITTAERDVVAPTVGTSTTNSFFTVNDSCVIVSDLWFNVSDLRFNITYPSTSVSSPDSNFTIANLTANGTSTDYTTYQKRGPYVDSVDDAASSGTHIVTIEVWGRELVTLAVDWTLDPDDSVYGGSFDTLNYDTLVVKQNGVTKSWSEGSVDMEDLTIKNGSSSNTFTFTWTAGGVGGVGGTSGAAVLGDNGTVFSDISDWFMASYLGVPLLVWIIIVALVAVGLVLAISKKSKK